MCSARQSAKQSYAQGGSIWRPWQPPGLPSPQALHQALPKGGVSREGPFGGPLRSPYVFGGHGTLPGCRTPPPLRGGLWRKHAVEKNTLVAHIWPCGLANASDSALCSGKACAPVSLTSSNALLRDCAALIRPTAPFRSHVLLLLLLPAVVLLRHGAIVSNQHWD